MKALISLGAFLALFITFTLAHAGLVPRQECRVQCEAFNARPDAGCIKHKPHHVIAIVPCKLRHLVRLCRHHGLDTCPTTTSTTSTTTSSTSPSSSPVTSTTTFVTTTTAGPLCPASGCTHLLDFTNGLAGGACGEIDSATGKLRDLTCGGLNIGGGNSTVAEGPTPDGSQSRFLLHCAAPTGGVCSVDPYDIEPSAQSADPDCSKAGCNFGTPLPIPNTLIPTLSTCVQNTFAADTSGSIDLDTGTSSQAVDLDSDIYLTGNSNQPCPRCAAGVCDRGINAGLPCVTGNSVGYTRDCPPGGVAPGKPCTAGGVGSCADGSAHVGIIEVNLTPLATRDVTATAANGLFCPSQQHAGCFGHGDCTSIVAHGSPAPVLASVFCIAATQSGLVNAAADLAGPGAVTLPGTYLVH